MPNMCVYVWLWSSHHISTVQSIPRPSLTFQYRTPRTRPTIPTVRSYCNRTVGRHGSPRPVRDLGRSCLGPPAWRDRGRSIVTMAGNPYWRGFHMSAIRDGPILIAGQYCAMRGWQDRYGSTRCVQLLTACSTGLFAGTQSTADSAVDGSVWCIQ